MPSLAGFLLLPVLEGMMQFSLGIFKHSKGQTSHQFNEENYPLPTNLKKYLKDGLFQMEFSAMLEEYVSFTGTPNCTEKLTAFMRQSFQLHEDPQMKTSFMEWVSIICIISVACYENGCNEALDIGKRIIRERCECQESLDEFKKLGCDV